MIPDTFIPVGTWVDLYAITGIAAGKRLIIVNKAAYGILVWEGSAPPGVSGGDNRHGYPLQPLMEPYVTSDTTGCWALFAQTGYGATARACIQEYIP